MRKITVVICLTAFSINAQVKVGIDAGAALTHLKFDGDSEQGGVLPSFYIGGLFGYRFDRIEPELEISYTAPGDRGQIKVRETFDSAPRKYNSDYDISMIIETVAVKFYVTEKFQLRTGGYIGQILSVNNEYTRGGNNPVFKTELSDSWKKTDVGFLLGINVGIGKKLFLEGTYMIGLSDMRGYGNTVTNRMVRVGAGYYFL